MFEVQTAQNVYHATSSNTHAVADLEGGRGGARTPLFAQNLHFFNVKFLNLAQKLGRENFSNSAPPSFENPVSATAELHPCIMATKGMMHNALCGP